MVTGVLCFGLAVYLVIAVVLARQNYVHGRGFRVSLAWWALAGRFWCLS